LREATLFRVLLLLKVGLADDGQDSFVDVNCEEIFQAFVRCRVVIKPVKICWQLSVCWMSGQGWISFEESRAKFLDVQPSSGVRMEGNERSCNRGENAD
jgi:hypothetical protein